MALLATITSEDFFQAVNEIPKRFSNKSSKFFGVGADAGDCFGVEEIEGLGVALGDDEGDGMGVKLGSGVGEALIAGLGEGVGVDFGVALATTPLFHTNFLPDLTQVKVLPLDTSLVPTLGQELPALGLAASATVNVERISAVTKPIRKVLLDNITQG